MIQYNYDHHNKKQ